MSFIHDCAPCKILSNAYRIIRPHEAFANQKVPYPGIEKPLDIRAGVNPALGDKNAAGSDSPGKVDRGRNVCFEGPQVTIVYSNQPCSGFSRNFVLTFIMDLDKGVQAEAFAQGYQVSQEIPAKAPALSAIQHPPQ